MSGDSVDASPSASDSPTVSPSGRTSPALAYLSSRHHHYRILEYAYIDHGGTAASTAALRLRPAHVLKTLILTDRSAGQPLVVVQHGDASVDMRRLEGVLGVKKGSVAMCSADKASEWSGYLVGGTSPFGLRRPMRVFVERSVTELRGPAEVDSAGEADEGEASIVINGGGRGLLVRMTVDTLMRALDNPQLIEVKAAAKSDTSKT